MRISDWSSDVCSSDLKADGPHPNPSPKGEGLESPAISHIHALTLASAAKSAKAARALKPAHSRTASWQMLPSSDRNGATRARARRSESVVEGKSVSVRVDLGGRRIIKKKKTRK